MSDSVVDVAAAERKRIVRRHLALAHAPDGFGLADTCVVVGAGFEGGKVVARFRVGREGGSFHGEGGEREALQTGEDERDQQVFAIHDETPLSNVRAWV